MELRLLARVLYLGLRHARVLLRRVRSLPAQARCRRQSLGRWCDHAGMDAAVAAAVPPVQRAAPDQGLTKATLTKPTMTLANDSVQRPGAITAPGNAYPQISLATPSDYLALMKPRVMSLVVFTAFVGLMIAPAHVHPVIGFTALLCIAVAAGSAGALNMWYDADIDAVMSRTSDRPIPRGRLTAGEAAGFGFTLAGFAIGTMGLLVNWLAAALLAFTVFF